MEFFQWRIPGLIQHTCSYNYIFEESKQITPNHISSCLPRFFCPRYLAFMHGSRKFHQGVLSFFCHQRISQRTSFEKQLDPKGRIASREGYVLYFPRTPIATYAFPGGGVGSGPPAPTPGPVRGSGTQSATGNFRNIGALQSCVN